MGKHGREEGLQGKVVEEGLQGKVVEEGLHGKVEDEGLQGKVEKEGLGHWMPLVQKQHLEAGKVSVMKGRPQEWL